MRQVAVAITKPHLQGIPFDTTDPMFSPDPKAHTNQPNGKNQPKRSRDSPLPIPLTPNSANIPLPNPPFQTHRSKNSQSSIVKQQIIPADEDVKRLFEECEIAKSNARVLAQALTFASPEELQKNEVIQVWTIVLLLESV